MMTFIITLLGTLILFIYLNIIFKKLDNMNITLDSNNLIYIYEGNYIIFDSNN
jgi:hypothetical protein